MPDVIDSYGNVKIVRTKENPLPMYIVSLPKFSPEEQKIIDDPKELIKDYDKILKSIENLKTPEEKEHFLRDHLKKELEKRGVSSKNMDELILALMDKVFLGYAELGIFMRDDNLEEVMVNGIETPVYVVHRKHGTCIANMEFKTHEPLNRIVEWLSRYANREISWEKPLLDTHMPDGSRANVAIAPAAPYGPTITIRKFKRMPYNIIDLIRLNSVSPDLAAFLWVCVEGLGVRPADMILAGGAGSGKTTLLNALAMFIPSAERVITVEDTLELNFDFLEDWVPLQAAPTVIEKAPSLDMHTLLKNSLRMRPDRVIVGEVRGSEAETLLVAMDIGLRGSMGTLHANNARETTIRLTNDPMNVPLRMIPLIDLIVVMSRIYDRKRGIIRRVTQVAEISGMEGDVIQMGDIYTWDINTDVIKRTEYPILLEERISKDCGISKRELKQELTIREKLLRYMVSKNISANEDIVKIFQKYHQDPKSVIEEIKNK